MADLGEEAFSSQMKVVATFLRLLEELMRNKQQDLRYGTKTQRRGILGRMKDFVGGIFKKVYDGTFGRLSRNGKDYGQLDLNDPAVAKLFADTMKQMGMDAFLRLMLLGWSLHSLFPVIEQFGGIAADFLFMSQAAVRRFG